MKKTPKQNSNKPSANELKQKRFRERQKAQGKKMVRGYITPQAMKCYKEINQITHWSDSETLSNALRLTYAAYKCGQINLLTKWLKEHEQSDENLRSEKDPSVPEHSDNTVQPDHVDETHVEHTRKAS